MPPAPIRPKGDILFIYRTARKRRYFNLLAENASAHLPVRVVFYHRLPSAGSGRLGASPDTAVLDALERAAQAQWFHARTSTLARWLKALSKPLVRHHLKSLYRRLYNHLSHTSPSLIVLWNGCKYQDKVLLAVNRKLGIPVCFFENGLLPATTTLDAKGINAENSVPRNVEFYANFPTEHQLPDKLTGRAYSRNRQQAQALPERYILVPFQLDRDSQILDNSPWIRSMEQLFDVCARALMQCSDSSLSLVFREHPSSKSSHARLHERCADNPRLLFDSQPDLQAVIDGAEAVVTVNSTVGMEALIRHQKVIVLGEACYALEGMAQRALNTDELARLFSGLNQWSPDTQLIDRFLYYLKHHYAIEGDWKQPDAAHVQSVQQRILDILAAAGSKD